MLKLIATAMFTMVAMFATASQGAVRTDEPTPGAEASQSVCLQIYQACKAGCFDFVGDAKGACLRECKAEYNECLAAH